MIATTSSGWVCDGSKSATTRPRCITRDPVGEVEDLFDLVGHQEHGRALRLELHYQFLDLSGLLHAQRSRRLVEDEQ